MSISPSVGNQEAIRRLKLPQNGKLLMRFLDLSNYCAKYVENFAKRAKPLYEAFSECTVNNIKARTPVCVPEFEKRRDQEQRESWIDKKSELSSPTISVSLYRYGERMLMKDSSGYGVGAVLLQKGVDENWRPIDFARRT